MNPEVAKVWMENSKSCDSFVAPMVPHFINYLNVRGKLNGRLLDSGCGAGHNANAFQKIGFGVTGVDYSQERITAAKESYPAVDFMCADLQARLPFDDSSFDVLFSCSVLQYLDHVVLEEYKRVLKKDGVIILIENLKNNPITRTARACLKAVGYNYQSYPHNYLTFQKVNLLKMRFIEPEAYFFHLFAPLAQFHALRKVFPVMHGVDRAMLSFSVLKRLCWLTLFVARNRK